MNNLITCVLIEGKKLFYSKVPIITLLVLAIVPLMGGFFMFVLKDPDLAQNLGLISAKANIMGVADWPSYFGLLAQAIAVGGMMVFGFITAWIFGREYSDRTVNDLLALPISRENIVLAKFIIATGWSLILSAFVLFLGIIVGKIVNIPLWSVDVLLKGCSLFAISAALTILLSSPVALVASLGRGYLAPLGFLIFTLVIAQIIALTGYGHYFPWSIPALVSGATGDDYALLTKMGVSIVLITSVLGVVGTMLWWRYADQN